MKKMKKIILLSMVCVTLAGCGMEEVSAPIEEATATPVVETTPAPVEDVVSVTVEEVIPAPVEMPVVADTNVYGNSAANAFNGGFIVEDEENYYMYYMYADCIYRTRKDTWESVKLGQLPAQDLNMLNGRLFGARCEEEGGIYEFNLENGEETQIRKGGVSRFIAVNNQLYYVDLVSSKLLKMDLDTMEETVLVNQATDLPVVYGDRIYFTLLADGESMYSMPCEGGAMEKLNDTVTYMPFIHENKVYYLGYQDGEFSIRSMNLDGSEDRVLVQSGAYSINVYQNYLYYIEDQESGNMFRVNLEGEPVKEVFSLEDQIRVAISKYATPAEHFEVIQYMGLNFIEGKMLFLCKELIDGNKFMDEFLYDFATDEILPLPAFCQEVKLLPSYTVEDLSKTMYAQNAVNVRKGPSTDYDKVGSLKTNQEVQVTGVANTGWYRIDVAGEQCFVSNKYLGEAPVVVEEPQEPVATVPETSAVSVPKTPATSAPARTYPAGDYTVGTVYGPKLNRAELDQVADAVQVFVNSYNFAAMSDYEKVVTAHNYLRDNCEFALDWSKNRANTAWGALVYHEAQCSGYARAMKALCDAIGIGCYYVHADDMAFNPSHQWNTVCIDGNWYIIDVQGNDRSGYDFFFLLSDATYAYFSGMSWDRSSVPACPNDYFR